ncbi:hypothetical protein B296_00023669 [Ensete ventricosum]|uniref:Uncharacterized protein n=1 Tax=Ensete ventricosum TaxID=4639 RepID=A0A427AJM0_ENSVE|nr:hypothetical protein B296_00023669 [Ensete ventricosum]
MVVLLPMSLLRLLLGFLPLVGLMGGVPSAAHRRFLREGTGGEGAHLAEVLPVLVLLLLFPVLVAAVVGHLLGGLHVTSHVPVFATAAGVVGGSSGIRISAVGVAGLGVNASRERDVCPVDMWWKHRYGVVDTVISCLDAGIFLQVTPASSPSVRHTRSGGVLEGRGN